jgi:cobalt-precorrin-7 (C5)-methyltransferase
MGYRDQVEMLQRVALLHHEGAKCVVVFMGDVHFSGFQFLERVERACGHPVETVAGISAAQILASRCRVCFDETSFITFHRRGDIAPFQQHLVHVLQDDRNVIVIPRPWDFMPKTIAAFLLARGVAPGHPTEVWERLTQNEAAWLGTLGDCCADFSDMSIMLIRTLHPMPSQLETVETRASAPVGMRSCASGVAENIACFKEDGAAEPQSESSSSSSSACNENVPLCGTEQSGTLRLQAVTGAHGCQENPRSIIDDEDEIGILTRDSERQYHEGPP